jgi:hypothetical protein
MVADLTAPLIPDRSNCTIAGLLDELNEKDLEPLGGYTLEGSMYALQMQGQSKEPASVET